MPPIRWSLPTSAISGYRKFVSQWVLPLDADYELSDELVAELNTYAE